MLLDTTFLIDLQREWSRNAEGLAHSFLRNHPDVSFRISVITCAEFLEGYHDPVRGDAFLSGFVKLELAEAAAWRAAAIRQELRAKGCLMETSRS